MAQSPPALKISSYFAYFISKFIKLFPSLCFAQKQQYKARPKQIKGDNGIATHIITS